MNFVYTLVLVVSLFSLSSCDKCSSTLDIDFRGIPASNDLIYETKETFQDCCEYCDRVHRCNAWTFIYETKVCVLKTSVGFKLGTFGSKFISKLIVIQFKSNNF